MNRHLNYDSFKFGQSKYDKKLNGKTSIHPSNVTPPPAYATLFNRSKIFTTDEYTKSFDVNNGKKQTINGRNYMVFRNDVGEPRLIPIRTPSATLFQYAYTK